jgi:hypothetical protein
MGDSTAAGDSLAAGFMVFIVVELAVGVFMLYLIGRILRKAGFSGWWALLMLIPLVNLAMFIVFAFADWPVQAQARLAGSRAGSPPAYGGRFPVPQQYPQAYPQPSPQPYQQASPQPYQQAYAQPYQQAPTPPAGELSQMSPQVSPPRYPESGINPAMGSPAPHARPAGGMPIDPSWRGPSPS